MAVNVVLNGVSYSIPDPGDTAWGQDTTDYFVAQASGLLQKAGGAFTLTAEVDFGATYGLKSTYFKSRATNPATAGQVRLGNAESISWRNAANGANLALLVNSSNVLTFNGNPIQGGISVSDTSTIDLTFAADTLSADVINASITNAKLATMVAHTFKGNNTGSTAAPLDLTATQLTAELNAMVGDSGSGGTKGLVPAPSSGDATKVLSGAGTWVTPGSGTVTSVTFTGDGTVLSSTPSSAVTTTGTLTASLKTQTANTVLCGPTSGSAANPTFRSLVPADYPMPVSAAKTNTYSILTTDELVLLDGTSTGFTATLPTAVGVTGKRYRIKRIDMTLANVVTLATTSSQTIDGVTTRTLNTQYECWEIVSDGSNWQVVTHHSTTPWTSYSPTYSAGFGTATNNFAFWRRVGSSVEIRANFTAGTVAGSVASVSLPSGLTGIMANTGVLSGNVGFDYTSTVSGVYPVMDSSALTVIKFGSTSGRSIGNFYNGNNWGNSTNFSLTASVPVVGWSE